MNHERRVRLYFIQENLLDNQAKLKSLSERERNAKDKRPDGTVPADDIDAALANLDKTILDIKKALDLN